MLFSLGSGETIDTFAGYVVLAAINAVVELLSERQYRLPRSKATVLPPAG